MVNKETEVLVAAVMGGWCWGINDVVLAGVKLCMSFTDIKH